MERALLQFVVLLLTCHYLGVCVVLGSVTIIQPLKDPETIVSSDQTFKLGFFGPANTRHRYVGILYNVPVQTVVWVANRDKPLHDSAGTFTISEDGNLVVLNGQKEILWSSNVSDSVRNSTAQLLDTGNLVLKDSSSGRIIWQSFQIPTDSFLRRMRISAAPGTTKKLTSWSSPSDPSTGNFSLGLETLPTAQLFIWNKSKPYWRSGPWNGSLFIGIPGMSYFGSGLVDDDSSKQNLLCWDRRVLIVEGICRGLLYLHRDSRLKIIHRDLKASNILLDEELNPKISDFGLARIFKGNQDQADTGRVVGTYGYMAPEYAMEGRFSEKSDVYSFGVLLLQIVSGRRNTSFSQNENGQSLLRYAWKLWNEGEAVKLIEPAIFDPNIETEILRYIHVGLLCVQELANDRPHVSAVLSMLNREISVLPRPKLPAFTERSISLECEFS